MPASGLVHDWISEQPIKVGLDGSQSVAVTEQCHSVVRIDDEGENPEGSPRVTSRGLDEEVDGRSGVCHNADQSTPS